MWTSFGGEARANLLTPIGKLRLYREIKEMDLTSPCGDLIVHPVHRVDVFLQVVGSISSSIASE